MGGASGGEIKDAYALDGLAAVVDRPPNSPRPQSSICIGFLMKPSGYETQPAYRINLLQVRNHMRVSAGGREIATSGNTILVDEQDHGVVVYFPSVDVTGGALFPVEARVTHCPFKGDATYWALAEGGEAIAWSYAEPYPEVAAIKDHVAFDQDRVDVTIGIAKD